MLGIVSDPAQIDAFRGKIDRSQLHMGFLEEAIRAQRHLERLGDRLTSRRGDDGGGQNYRIGVDGKPLAEYGISRGDPQDRPAVRLDRLHLGSIFRLKADELHVLIGRFPVLILP